MTTLLQNQFDYSIIEGEVGTEEHGISVLRMCLQFSIATMCDALEINARARNSGRIDTGLTPSVLFQGVLMLAELRDESLVPLLQSSEDEITQFCMEHLMEKGLIHINDDGTIIGRWTTDESDEDEYSTLDGIVYPMVTTMSPDRVLFFAENKDLFQVMHPSGSFAHITNSVRHIKENLVSVTEHKGKYLYSLV